jgi:hypothetical protein
MQGRAVSLEKTQVKDKGLGSKSGDFGGFKPLLEQKVLISLKSWFGALACFLHRKRKRTLTPILRNTCQPLPRNTLNPYILEASLKIHGFHKHH